MTRANVARRDWTLAELAAVVGGEIRGDRNKSVCRIAELGTATSDSVTHCSASAHLEKLKSSQAGIVILDSRFQDRYAGDSIVTNAPRIAFGKVIDLLHPPTAPKSGVHSSAVVGNDCSIANSSTIGANAVIGDSVQIGENTVIEAGAVIEDAVQIGDGTHIGANSTIYRRTKIGHNCRFSAGVVLGAPGFSFEWDGERWIPIRNIGSVTIGDDVDLGACTSIDRASIGDTRVDDGVRIDNNCHIGHNVQIGANTLIVANVGIAGSVKIGQCCVIGGQVAIKDNVSIADEVTILGTSLVSKSITSAGTYSSAVPARKASEWNRTLARLNTLEQ